MGFSNIHSDAKQQKIEGGTLWGNKISEKKSRSAEKKERGDLLVSPGMVCYAEKQEKPFWFSSLVQMVQFGAIIFCRTFKNYFGQFVWIEKKRKANIIVAFHFMKHRLKIRPILDKKKKVTTVDLSSLGVVESDIYFLISPICGRVVFNVSILQRKH